MYDIDFLSAPSEQRSYLPLSTLINPFQVIIENASVKEIMGNLYFQFFF